MKFSMKLMLVLLVMLAASSAFAVPYHVTIDTTSLNGTPGYLYLQYGGLNAVPSTATVSDYSGGVLAAANSANVVNGSALSGMLPNTVVFANTNGINDYNHGITFGNAINFNLLFASNSFGAPAGGNSTFSLGLYGDENGSTPLLGGTLFTIDLKNDGNTSYEVFSNHANVAPVPEPGTIVLLSAGLLGLCIYGKRRINVTAA